jgi:hypothetical protein
MTPAAWFIVALRVLGIWQVLAGIEMAAGLFTVSRGLSHPTYSEPGAYFTASVEHFLAALVLLMGAPAIAGLFYPGATRGLSDNSSEIAQPRGPVD